MRKILYHFANIYILLKMEFVNKKVQTKLKMLSKKTKYAINALVYLAKKPPKEPVLISEIAEHEHIPKKFLETILLDLRNAGILNSKKGKGGGYYLNKKPS
jgi:Rrf2 family protein